MLTFIDFFPTGISLLFLIRKQNYESIFLLCRPENNEEVSTLFDSGQRDSSSNRIREEFEEKVSSQESRREESWGARIILPPVSVKKSAQDVINEVFASPAGQDLLQKGPMAREEGNHTVTSSTMKGPFMIPLEPEPDRISEERETIIVNPYSLVNLVGKREEVC